MVVRYNCFNICNATRLLLVVECLLIGYTALIVGSVLFKAVGTFRFSAFEFFALSSWVIPSSLEAHKWAKTVVFCLSKALTAVALKDILTKQFFNRNQVIARDFKLQERFY